MTENGFTVSATTAITKTIGESREAYRQLLQVPANQLCKNIAVSRTYSPYGAKVTDACQDDRVWGASRTVLQYLKQKHPDMKDFTVFVTFNYTYSSLNKIKEQTLLKVVDKVMNNLRSRNF